MGNTDDTMNQLSLLYQAVRDTCPWIPREVKGRKPYNRALIPAILILGIQRGWIYRRMEQFCMENMKAIKKLVPAWEGYPDHGVFYLAARSDKHCRGIQNLRQSEKAQRRDSCSVVLRLTDAVKCHIRGRLTSACKPFLACRFSESELHDL